MIQYFSVINQQLVNLSDQQALTSNRLWINLEHPSSTEIKQVTTNFKLQGTDLSAVYDKQQTSRFTASTIDNPITTVLLQYPKYVTSPLGYLTHSTYPIEFIITNDVVITISNQPASFIQDFILRQQPLNSEFDDFETFIAKLVWFIANDFVTTLNSIATKMDLLERQLTSATENEQIYQIMAIQKTVIDFKYALQQNQATISAINQNQAVFSQKHLQPIFSEVVFKNKQAITMVNMQGETLEQYSNMVSAVVSNNLNDVMKVLTSLTLIMTIPTIIGGIYGMNVTLPGAQLASAFSILAFFTIVICIITYFILKKKKYL